MMAWCVYGARKEDPAHLQGLMGTWGQLGKKFQGLWYPEHDLGEGHAEADVLSLAQG